MQPMLSLYRLNCSTKIENYPTYVLHYVNERNGKAKIEKLFSCGDNDIFFNDRPCVLLLRNDHFLNVWNYTSMFNEVDCPTINNKKWKRGSGDRYKKTIFLRCMVSFSND